MSIRVALTGLAFGISAALIGPQAWADSISAAVNPTIDVTISYFAPGLPGPDTTFAGSQLVGNLRFYTIPPPSDFGLLPHLEGPPIDVGMLGVGQTFEVLFHPPNPCVADRACAIGFSFGGVAAGFPAHAYPPGPPTFPADGAAAFSPLISLGSIPPGPPCRSHGNIPPGPPCRTSGAIYAFDAPVQVGVWTATFGGAPEPGVWGMMLLGLGGVGTVLRRQRSAEPTGAA